MKKSAKIIIAIVAAVCVISVGIVAAILIAKGGSGEYKSHIKLAEQYLEELNYEQAIAEYRLAIEIEPKKSETYVKLADVYVEMEDYSGAIEVLKNGVEETGNQEVEAKLDTVMKTISNQEIPHFNEAGEKDYSVEYDSNGNLIKRVEYKSNGEVRRIDEYGSEGKLIKQIRYKTNETYEVNEYNGDGKCVKTIVYYLMSDEWYVSKWKDYEYDASGNLIKENCYDEYDSLYEYGICECDSAGNCIKITHYSPNGDMVGWTVCEYDSNGNRIKESFYLASGVLTNSVGYDTEGNEITYTHYEMNDHDDYFISEYDMDGKCIKGSDYVDGVLNYYIIYEYDKTGNEIRGTWYWADQTLYCYWVNEYDTEGNKIKYTLYSADGTVSEVHKYDAAGNRIDGE